MFKIKTPDKLGAILENKHNKTPKLKSGAKERIYFQKILNSYSNILTQ